MNVNPNSKLECLHQKKERKPRLSLLANEKKKQIKLGRIPSSAFLKTSSDPSGLNSQSSSDDELAIFQNALSESKQQS